jgi:hypothetical protein
MVAMDDQVDAGLGLAGKRAERGKKYYKTASYSCHGGSYRAIVTKHLSQPRKKKSRPEGRLPVLPGL